MVQIHFLNVGEGDCTWINHTNGANTVIDVCLAKAEKLVKAQDSVTMYGATTKPNSIRGNYNQAANPENPIQYLQKFGVNSVFRFILSHPDMDHMDGMKDFFEAFKPTNFWDTKNNKPKPDFGKQGSKYNEEDWDFYQSIRGSKGSPTYLCLYDGSNGKYYNKNEDGTSGGNGLYILSPTNSHVTEANKCGDFNDCSYVILYKTGKFKILFCGDAGNKTFEHLIANHRIDISNVDLLIAPHHGRKGTIDFSFLDIMKPKLTFFGNASSEHLAYEEWRKRGLEKITNNQAGSLIATFEDSNMNVYARHESFAKSYNPNTFKADDLDAWYLRHISK